MGYKNGGLKTKYVPPRYSGGPSDSYTIYAAYESVSDIMVYVMINDETEEEVELGFGSEDDCADGIESLIDVMFYLKHKGVGTYHFNYEYQDIVIEEMTEEEIDKYFRT